MNLKEAALSTLETTIDCGGNCLVSTNWERANGIAPRHNKSCVLIQLAAIKEKERRENEKV